MRKVVDAYPANSLILVMDGEAAELPEGFVGIPRVAATPSCVALGTFSQADGSTRITLGVELPPLSGKSLVFDGLLQTPNRNISVYTVVYDVLLSCGVPGKNTKIQIWSNDSREPDEIDIVILH
jgi:hypothetical protein